MADVVDLRVKLKVEYDKSEVKKIGQQIGKAINQSTTISPTKAKKVDTIIDIKAIKAQLAQLKTKFQDAAKPLRTLMNRVGRIALYRAIRTLLKSISQALQEGVNNLYQWSKLQNDVFGKTFANSMDKMATAWLYLKNSVATVVAPLLEGIANLVDKVTDAVVQAIEKLSQFIGYLSNTGYYLKATKYNIAYAKSVNAVKNALLGFDELNILNTNDTSDAITDYGSIFEKAALEEMGFGFNLALSVKDIFFNWDDVTPESVAQKIVTGLNALTGAFIGWKLGGVSGALLGATLGASIGAIISSLVFDNDGKISPDELGALIWAGLVGLVGGVIGFNFLKVKGATMGFTVGASLGMILYNATFNSGRNKMNDSELATLLKAGLLPIMGGVLGMIFLGAVLSPLGGAALGIGIGVVLTMILQGISWDTKGVSYEVPQSLVDEVKKETSIAGDYDAIKASLKADNNTLKGTLTDLKNSLKANGYSDIKDEDWWKKYYSGNYATGGTPDVGSLFWAGENGAELIAQVGGRSTVYNEAQLGESLAYANESVVNAINTLIGVVRSKSNNVTISASDIRKAVNTSSMRVGV